jgi:hypothetical protein
MKLICRAVFSTVKLATILAVSGCAGNTVRSVQTEVCKTDSLAMQGPSATKPCAHGIPSGLVYALPKGQVMLAAYRKPISAADVAKAQADVASANQALADASNKLAAAQATQTKNAAAAGETAAQKGADLAAVTAAQATLAAAQALVQSATAKLADIKSGLPKPTPDDLIQANQLVADAKVKVDGATAALAEAQKQTDIDAAKTALAKANKGYQDAEANLVKIKNDVQPGKFVETVTLTPLSIIPEDTQRFVANLDHSAWRDDSLKLSVANGLLTSSNTQSTDQTANIIENLASAAIGIVTFFGAGVPVVPPSTTPPTPARAPGEAALPCDYVYSQVFDPTSATEVSAVSGRLQAADIRAHFVLWTTLSARTPAIAAQNISTYAKDPTAINGLVYRTPVGVTVFVVPTNDANTTKDCPLQTKSQAQSLQVFVPDTNADFIAPIRAGALTASSTQFAFSNGMMTDYSLNQPSEALAFSSIPVDIVNKIMTIPTSILKLRLDYTTAQTSLASQQAALITAQGSEAIALVNARTALQTAETNLATADINDPTARFNALTALVQAREALTKAIAAAAQASAVSTKPASP